MNTIQHINSPYKNTKKWFWLLSVIYPAISLPAIYFHYETNNALWLFYPFFITYFLTPILDTLIGEDSNNPPLEIIPKLEKEKYYRLLTFLTIPIHYIVFLVSASYAAMQPLNWWEFLLVASSAGLASGLAINTGHELGHKKSRLERNLAKIVLAAILAAIGGYLAAMAAIGGYWRQWRLLAAMAAIGGYWRLLAAIATLLRNTRKTNVF